MTLGIDPSFRLKKQAHAARRKQIRRRRLSICLGVVAFFSVAGAVYLSADYLGVR